MIVCRSRAEIEKLRRVNQLVAQVLAELRQMAGPGVTTADIDHLAEERVRAAGAEPAFKGYHGYPATVCVSANEQVVRERLKVYERATKPLVDFYRDRPTFRVVNGAQAQERVAHELDTVIDDAAAVSAGATARAPVPSQKAART